MTDAFKAVSKRRIHESAEATSNFIGNKTIDKLVTKLKYSET